MNENGVKILKILGLACTIIGTILTGIGTDKSNKLELAKLAEKHLDNK